MIEFGKTLREAREAKGLTTGQIAEQTHLLPQIVEELEREDFHRITAPIYGRGFVKLYCETVGLEPKPLVDEFMAILNGEREPAIRIREVAMPQEETAEPTPPPEPPKPVYVQPGLGGDLAAAEPEVGPAADLEPTPVAPLRTPIPVRTAAPTPAAPAAPAIPAFSDGARQETGDGNIAGAPRQYHPDYARPASFGLPPNTGRLAILAAGALAIIALLFFGGRAVYRVSMGISGESPQPEANVEPKPATPEKTTESAGAAKQAEAHKETPPAKASRVPKDVPPLYID